MNRVPVAFPQSHTESSSSHISILHIFHIFTVTSLSFRHLFHYYHCHFSLSRWLPHSLSLFLSPSLHLLLLLPIVSYDPSLSFLPFCSVLEEAQQMMSTLTACGRSTTRFTDSSVEESRDTKKRKQDGVIWRPSSFVMYLQSPTVTLLWDIL